MTVSIAKSFNFKENLGSRMKIGFDAKRLFLNASGLGNYSRNLVAALQEHYPANTFLLFTPGVHERAAVFSQSPYTVVAPKAFHHRLLTSAWRSSGIIQQINALKPDVYHGLSNELPFTIHAFKGKKIVTIHDLIFLRYPDYYKAFDRRTYRKKVRHACESADVVISISTQTKNDLVEWMKVPEEKIVVHGQSCNKIYWEHDKIKDQDQVLGRYGLPSEFILYVGTVEPRKNLLELLKAMREIRLPLVVVGRLKNKYGQEVMQFIRQQGLQDRVFFPTAVNDADLAVMYRKAQCLVYPSSFEGFGLPVLEAMVCGCPVITGNQSSMPEVGGAAAQYIKVDETSDYIDKIRTVLDQPGMREQMVRLGHEQSRLFSYEAWARKTFETYAA